MLHLLICSIQATSEKFSMGNNVLQLGTIDASRNGNYIYENEKIHQQPLIWMNEKGNSLPRTTSSFGTKRVFSSKNQPRTNFEQHNGFFSFIRNEQSELRNDLSTRHVDNTDDSNLKEFLWNRIPGNKHFTISDNLKFILNCCMWYISSSLTNNIGKTIMNVFKYPITLTFVQFGLVAIWCYLISTFFTHTHIRTPTKDIVKTIAPLAVFLIIGHVFSSVAISRIPVSLVHTIKVRKRIEMYPYIWYLMLLGFSSLIHSLVLSNNIPSPIYRKSIYIINTSYIRSYPCMLFYLFK